MKKVSLELGSGGQMMRSFITEYILANFQNPFLKELSDAAYLPQNIAFTTDSYVVDPIFFPGGDIGTLSVNGTVNDLVVSGSVPKYLSLSLILEEGLSWESLEKILFSVKKASEEAKVKVITGDTKVVRQGQGDKIYINTAGIGEIIGRPAVEKVRPGDKLVVTGTLGEHSLAVMLARGDFGLEAEVVSDCAPLNFLLPFWNKGTLWMRDITRGGLATVLYELVEKLPFALVINEQEIPLSPAVKGATELLGIDPLYLACEGRAVCLVKQESASDFTKEMRLHRLGSRAALIGEVSSDEGRPGELLLRTASGGLRLLEPLTSELLPRIC